MFFKLIFTSQRNVQHFPISFYNIQSVRNASPIFPTAADAQPTPAEFSSWWLNSVLQPHTFTSELQFTISPLLEQNLLSKRAGWAEHVRRLYFHYIIDFREQRPYYGKSCPQRTLQLLPGGWKLCRQRSTSRKDILKIGIRKHLPFPLTRKLKTGFYGK